MKQKFVCYPSFASIRTQSGLRSSHLLVNKFCFNFDPSQPGLYSSNRFVRYNVFA